MELLNMNGIKILVSLISKSQSINWGVDVVDHVWKWCMW